MKFLKSKVVILFIIIVSILCLVSISIAVRISITMVNKQDHVVKPMTLESQKAVQSQNKSMNINKLTDQIFYFNGQALYGINAFTDGKENFFVPIDTILENANISFKYYASDDILEYAITGKKISIKLSESSFLMGNERISLNATSVAAKNHILVPIEILANMNGFTVDKHPDKKTVFINYFPEYASLINKLKTLKLINGTANISEVLDEKLVWDRKYSGTNEEEIEKPIKGSDYILRSGDNMFIIKPGENYKLEALKINPSATWSMDGKYLYWRDSSKKLSYVYNVASKKTSTLSDYFLKINRGEDGYPVYDGELLSDYVQTSRYKRVSLINTDHVGNYTFIERRGKTLINGNLFFSPDKKKVLYYKENEGYYTANSDGTKITFLGNGLEAKWVNNDKVFVRTQKELFLFSDKGKNKIKVEEEYSKVGQTPQGDVFFTVNNVLYCETKGQEKKIIKLPWACDYIYANTIEGPYIAVSSEEDVVSYIEGSNIKDIGFSTSLLKGIDYRDVFSEKNQSISSSPNDTNVLVIQKKNDFVELNIIDTEKSVDENIKQKKVILNCRTDDKLESDTICSKWISNDSLLVYTSHRGWVVDIKNGIKVFGWTERAGTKIEDILIN